MAETKKVAVAFRGGEPHLARLLRGIAGYAQQCGRWTLACK
jgi:sulfatase maturation enzyme AslB (radical SAM superfamily)